MGSPIWIIGIMLPVNTPNLPMFSLGDAMTGRNRVRVVGDFNVEAQTLPAGILQVHGFFLRGGMKGIQSGALLEVENDAITFPSLSTHWLAN